MSAARSHVGHLGRVDPADEAHVLRQAELGRPGLGGCAVLALAEDHGPHAGKVRPQSGRRRR